MEPVLIAVCLLGGLLVGALISWLAMKAKVGPALSLAQAQKEEGERAKAELSAALQDKAGLTEKASRVEVLEADIRKREEDMRGLIAQFNDVKARLEAFEEQKSDLEKRVSETFASLAGDALDKNSKRFLDIATQRFDTLKTEAKGDLDKRHQAIDNLVKPLQEGIKAVADSAIEMENKREKAFGTIEEQLKQSIEQAAEVARQTSGLKDALKKPNVRGRWGEVQLRNCIELAGMDEHCDVAFQASTVGPDEDVVRPDAIVRMPGGRRIAIDAKTPMDPFIQFVDATTDEERNAALVRHGRSVKKHISDLAKTEYMKKVKGSPDFVVMFLPNESFLAMALENEPGIMEEALTKKVLVTTPGTLIGLLNVVRFGWEEEKLTVNAQQIADEGAKLNTELTRFLEDFARLGIAIKAASDAYHESEHRVEKQITNSSQRLTSLGAKSRKVLSAKADRFLSIGEVEPPELPSSVPFDDEPVTHESAAIDCPAEADSNGIVTVAAIMVEN